MQLSSQIRLALLAPLLTLLLACAVPPTVVASKVVEGVNNTKLNRIVFVYQETQMAVKSSYGVGSASVGSTGFTEFGGVLAKEAKASLAKSNLDVLVSVSVPDGRWRSEAPKIMSSVTASQQAGAALITVFPISGTASTNFQGDSVYMRYEVRVVDVESGKLRWSGLLDTSTWSGKGWMYKDAKKVTYDSSYADRFFDALVAKLKADKLM